MATAEEKEKIKTLASKGQSVNTIKDKTGLPKSTVYYHFKKEVGQKQKENRLKIPEDEEVKGEICGIFAGDGNYYKDENHKYRIRIFLNLNDSYWPILADFMEEELGKRPRIYKYEDKSRATLDYASKELYSMFKKNLDWEDDKTETIRPSVNKDFSREFKIGFLRGLMDTDGYKGKYRNIFRFNTISGRLAESISHYLFELGIENSHYTQEDKRETCRDMHRVSIFKDSKKLEKIIKPRHPKKSGNLSEIE